MMDTITQICVLVLGVSAVFLCGVKDKKIARWGFVVGLASQPFWFYTTWTHNQPFIFVAAIFYTLSWLNGIRNNMRGING